jgi:hypothetical protein
MDRICKKCGEEKNIKEFVKTTGRSTYGRRWMCYKCRSIQDKVYRKKPANIAWFKKYVVSRVREIRDILYAFDNGKCYICDKKSKRIEYHHILGMQEGGIQIGRMHGYSPKRILAELNECIPLCRSCHAKAHYEKLYKDAIAPRNDIKK